MRNCPRILLCAPASGSGKTTVTCAILQALVNRGLPTAAFKSGPDYIDPMFHSEIIGARSRNLDLFLMGEAAVRRSLWDNAPPDGVAVIEGAMGFYDGIAMSADASAYALAKTLAAPAVLVLDARGRALSAAALVKGMAEFRADSGLKGVILNRVAPMRYPQLKGCVERETGLKVYGFLPERPDCALESRHLGLVTAGEVADLREKLAALSAQAEETVDLDGLLALARSAPALEEPPQALPQAIPGRPRIAVARDRAFCFYYADALALLERLGAELVEFSPLRDERLPEGCSGLYLGGGYPELFARELSANGGMRAAIRSAVADGLPTVAECGGFLYLHKTLEDDHGQAWPMAGVLDQGAWNGKRLGRFGYVTLTAERDGLLCPKGARLPAHEFHYWESGDPGGAFQARKPQSDRGWRCGWHSPTLYAGFPHFHFCGAPEAAGRFVAACAAFQARRLTQ